MKTISRFFSIFLLGLLLVGCGSKVEPDEVIHVPQKIEQKEDKVMTDDLISEEASSDITERMNAFSFTMGSKLYQEYEGENFVNAPISLWIPLAALVNAVEEDSQEEVLTGLGLQGMSVEEINRAAAQIFYFLNKEERKAWHKEQDMEYQAPLTIANMIFVDNEYTLDEMFAEIYQLFYNGTAMTVDFSSEEAVNAVNEWAYDNTNGKIERVVEFFSEDTVAAIANAIYFSDRWSTEFNKNATQSDVFYGDTEELTADYMIRTGAGQNYYEDEEVQATALNFVEGGRLYIILPKEKSASQLFEELNTTFFEKMEEEMDSMASGTLRLPKFSISGDSMDLMQLLEELEIGLTNPDRAVITGLVSDAGNPLYVSSAVQKAMIEIDEEGATAAAVTVLAVSETSLLIEEPKEEFEMYCNRPFVFVLTEQGSNGESQILFTGVVNAPNIMD